MKATTAVLDLVLWAAGIGFALFIFFGIAVPFLFGITREECWNVGAFGSIENIKSDFNGLTPGGAVKKRTVILQDCVDSIRFINKDQLVEVSGILECTSGYDAYIIALPYYKETKSGLRVWKWFEDGVVEEVEEWYKKNLRAFKPTCVIMDCNDCYFSGAPIVLEGSRKEGETKPYCLTMSRSGQEGKTYNIDVREGECK